MQLSQVLSQLLWTCHHRSAALLHPWLHSKKSEQDLPQAHLGGGPATPSQHASQTPGTRGGKCRQSADEENTPVEQVLRAAAANIRFSDCPPEHTDKIAQSLSHLRLYMQQMSIDRRLSYIRQIADLAHEAVLAERREKGNENGTGATREREREMAGSFVGHLRTLVTTLFGFKVLPRCWVDPQDERRRLALNRKLAKGVKGMADVVAINPDSLNSGMLHIKMHTTSEVTVLACLTPSSMEKNMCVDKLISALANMTYDKLFQRLVKLRKNKPTSRIAQIKKNHLATPKIDVGMYFIQKKMNGV
ncbi:hypothetical protein HPB47_014426 [Ixodes persulcatus]|uniref:Uncharacterized protein n=1 Tax=Ixodes persulcatus TaxID=34615 RepID=A0AC60QXD9_IXOPE|nr:hypothetical protein HPB47_014426 [Ixodes persulcatus]